MLDHLPSIVPPKTNIHLKANWIWNKQSSYNRYNDTIIAKKIFKIKNKGFIKENYDADIIIVDMEMKKKIRNKDLATKVKWSPFDGKLIVGWPVMTFVNGNMVYENGKFFPYKGREVEFGD